ncbi:hypothetical protein CTH30272_01159 [Allocatenococcus thiocycli]|nr:hypothetical protein CTH30272_01159 [Catenococcus thiocycli]
MKGVTCRMANPISVGGIEILLPIKEQVLLPYLTVVLSNALAPICLPFSVFP